MDLPCTSNNLASPMRRVHGVLLVCTHSSLRTDQETCANKTRPCRCLLPFQLLRRFQFFFPLVQVPVGCGIRAASSSFCQVSTATRTRATLLGAGCLIPFTSVLRLFLFHSLHPISSSPPSLLRFPPSLLRHRSVSSFTSSTLTHFGVVDLGLFFEPHSLIY